MADSQEYKTYAETWRQRRRAEREALPLLQQRLSEVAQNCANLLANKYAVRKE